MKVLTLALAAAAVVIGSSSAEARPRKAPQCVPPFGCLFQSFQPQAQAYKNTYRKSYRKAYRKKVTYKRVAHKRVTPARVTQTLAAPVGTIASYKAAHTSRACLTSQTRSILNALEARVGAVKIVSTCVVKNIAGTGRRSYHSYGMAVDFHTRNKAAAIAFLKTQPVLVMTYSNMSHVHFNTGQKGAIFAANAYGGGKKRYVKRRHVRYAGR